MKYSDMLVVTTALLLPAALFALPPRASAQPADVPSAEAPAEEEPTEEPYAEADQRQAEEQPESNAAEAARRRAWLGVELLDAPDGVRIGSVVVDSPAYLAGIRPGDKLVSVDETATRTAAEVIQLIDRRSAGDKVTVEVIRGSVSHKVAVTLATAPYAPGHPPLGTPLVPGDFYLDFRVSPPEIEQLRRRIDALEKQIEAMRREISELRRSRAQDSSDKKPAKSPPAAGAIEL